MSELFHDSDGTAYARYGLAPALQTWPIESRTARDWMAQLYYRVHGSAPSLHTLTAVTATLGGIARYDGPEHVVHLRTAYHEGTVVHDLGDELWRAVTITADGWSVGSSPVIFRRTAAARAIRAPVRGGSLLSLVEGLGLLLPEAKHVIVWIVAALMGDGPVPILELTGPAGAGKSTVLRRIRSVVDPSEADRRAAPRSVEDLYVAAQHSYVVAGDNVSHISGEISDALCVICSGGGYAKRTLFTTADETVLRVRRPIVLTSVAPVITASDLLDRAIAVSLPVRADVDRATEVGLDREWDATLAGPMGALYDLVAEVLRERPDVQLPAPPRMADYAVIGETVSRVVGWPSYAAEYAAHRLELAARGVDSSPVATALVAMMADRSTWSGSVGGLAGELVRWREDSDAWPRSARGVADAIRRSTPGLNSAGIVVEWDTTRRRDGYHVTIRQRPHI